MSVDISASPESYLKVFLTAPDPFFLVSAEDNTFVDVNQAFSGFLKIDRSDLLKKKVDDFDLWEDPEEMEKIETVLRTQGRVKNVEVSMRIRSKTHFCLYSAEMVEVDGENCIVGVIKDITELRQVRKMLKEKDRELLVKTRQLEEVNEALRLLLSQSKEETKKLEQRIVANVEDLVMPYVKRMKDTDLDVDQEVYMSVIESNLTELMAPFMRMIGSKHANLTPREIEVANLVRMGTTSKEIAKLLKISKRAVEFHRDSLRKKLGLKKTKRNLRAYLASLN